MIMDLAKMEFVSASLDMLAWSAKHEFAQMIAMATEFAQSTRHAAVVKVSLVLTALCWCVPKIAMTRDIATTGPATAFLVTKEPCATFELALMTVIIMGIALTALVDVWLDTVELTARHDHAPMSAPVMELATNFCVSVMKVSLASTVP
jgi:hypothetical protein